MTAEDRVAFASFQTALLQNPGLSKEAKETLKNIFNEQRREHEFSKNLLRSVYQLEWEKLRLFNSWGEEHKRNQKLTIDCFKLIGLVIFETAFLIFLLLR